MATSEVTIFTSDDKYFGVTRNGKLKIWDTSTGICKDEYTPNKHLSSPCTCLTWIVTAKNHSSNGPSHKRPTAETCVAVMGTASGSISLFGLATGEVEAELIGGHNSKVNHLTWSRGTNLFSCSDDKYIVEWNITTKKVVSKWKTGKECASCILVLPDGKSLLAANYSINWWNLTDKTIVKTFTGHSSPVTSLKLALGANSKSGNYFVSAARDDNYLSAWPLDKSSTKCVASFVMEDIARNVSVLSGGSTGPTVMTAVTRSGVLHVFNHQLNGKYVKPLKPSLTVVTALDTGKNKTAQATQIPFINAQIGKDGSIMIAYGGLYQLAFERINPTCKEKLLCLTRQDPRNPAAKSTEAVSKLKTPATEENVVYVSEATAHKRKSNGKVQSELPMELRLENLMMNAPDVGVMPVHVNSMAALLVQGLLSKEDKILRNVLMRREPELITNTVLQLPVRFIGPLIQELTRRIQGKVFVSRPAVQWLKCVLQTHAGQLLALPELGDIFSGMLGMIESRLQVLAPLTRLTGRLDLLVEQIGTGSKLATSNEDEALLVYEDPGSSDDESDMDGGVMQTSETEEDHWDEQSESLEDDARIAEIQEDDVDMSE